MPIRRRTREGGKRPLFASGDAWLLLEIPLLMVMATLLPERRWLGACQALERIKARLGVSSDAAVLRGLEAMGLIAATPDNALTIAAYRTEHHMQIVREFLWGWTTPIDVEGTRHLEASTEAGHGAILWVAHFSFNSLAVKKGIRAAGIGVSHLSRPEHGFSKSRFGIAFLNPVRVRTEKRYLDERVVIDAATPVAAINRARQLLRENRVISITAGAWEGSVLASAALANCTQEFATGAPRLSLLTGAPVHPVFCVRDEASGRMKVLIGEALEFARGERQEALSSCAQAYADRLLPMIKRYAIQWRDWDKMRPRSPV
jgi:hypothetical protein